MNLNVPGHRIIKLLGTGSMGMVYLAEQPALQRQVALKALYPHHAKSRIRRERFFNEARVMANLVHPNIVQLFNLQEANGNIIIVMEFINGRNMDEMIGFEYGPLVTEKALPLITDMLKGLGYAHSMDIIHRDIKPGNVMVTHGHVAKITDFGVAKLIGRKGMTKAGAQVGTLAYMSPEQVLGKDVDQRSDIYSLGMTLYEMLAGRLPSDGQDISDRIFMDMILNERLPDPRDYYPHIPEWLVALVYKAIEKKPENRFYSCEEFLGELKSGLTTGSVSVSLKKPFFSRFSSTIMNILSPPRTPVPTYFGDGSSGSGIRGERSSSSSGYQGETFEHREERKRKQLEELPGKHSEKMPIDDSHVLSIEEDNKNEILSASEIAAEMDREFKEAYPEESFVIVHEPEDLINSRIEQDGVDSEESGDPIDSDNEPSKFSTFLGRTRNKVAGIAILIASAASVFMFVNSGSADSLSDMPVTETEIEIPFQPHLQIVGEINTAGIITGIVGDAAISEDGDIAFVTADMLSVHNASTSSWNSTELTKDTYDVAFIPGGGISCSQDSKEMILFSSDLEEYRSLDYELESPSNVDWISDSLFYGIAPFYRPGDAAGHGIYMYDSTGDERVLYAEYSFDISQYSRPSLIPREFVYSIYYNKPITAFSKDGSVYVSSSSDSEYSIDHYITSTDRSGILVSILTGTITHEFHGVAKGAEQLEAESSLYIERMGEEPPENWASDSFLSVVKSLEVDGENRLWVLRGNTEEIVFDIFSFEDEFVGSVIADLPNDKNWQFRIAGSSILAFSSDDWSTTVYLMEYIEEAREEEIASDSSGEQP